LFAIRRGSNSAFTSWKSFRFDLFIFGQRASFMWKGSYEIWVQYISRYITAYTCMYMYVHINLCRNYFWNWTDERKKYSHISNASMFKLKTSLAFANALLISRPNKIPSHKIFRVVRFWIYFPHAHIEFAVDCSFDLTVFHSILFLKQCIGNPFFPWKIAC